MARLAEVVRHPKISGLYHVVHAGLPALHIQRVARAFWQLVDNEGRSSDHDSLREAREEASIMLARRSRFGPTGRHVYRGHAKRRAP